MTYYFTLIACLASLSLNAQETNAQLANKYPDSDTKSWFDGITFQADIFALGFTLICFLTLLILLRSKLNTKDFERFSRKIKENQSLQPQRNYVDTSNNYDIQILKLTDDIAELKQRIINSGRSLPPSFSHVPIEVTNSNEQLQEPEQNFHKAPEAVQDTFFLPTPASDGSFESSNVATVYREGISIYKAVKTGPAKANFQINDHETSLKLALQYAEIRISPCCTQLNAYNATARQIITVQPGKLELRGDKWLVTDKTQIRYEN